MTDSHTRDSSFQQLIASAFTLTVATTIAFIKANHKSEMLSLREMIEKSLLLIDSSSATLPLDLDATPKSPPGGDFLPKVLTERWNQADLGYFDLDLNGAYREDEIVSVRKDVYYKNVFFFVQYLQNLVTFQGTTLIKTNIAMSPPRLRLKMVHI